LPIEAGVDPPVGLTTAAVEMPVGDVAAAVESIRKPIVIRRVGPNGRASQPAVDDVTPPVVAPLDAITPVR
jgi:hypothetical protein